MPEKGDYVEIYDIVLASEDRTANIPADTKNVNYEMWVKGFLLNSDAEIGDVVEIETIIGRRIKGVLERVNPSYTHSFGNLLPEIFEIGKTVKRELFGDKH